MEARTFFTKEVPQILGLLANSLQRRNIPESWKAFRSQHIDEQFNDIPFFTCVILTFLTPFVLIYRSSSKTRTYHYTRILLIRGMGVCYLAGFLTAAFQIRPLFGSLGVDPTSMLKSDRPKPMFELFELFGFPFSDVLLELFSWIGVFLSLLLICTPFLSFIIPLLTWVLYLSLVNLGTLMLSYGWEWLTLEMGFLVIFLCPIFSKSRYPKYTPPSTIILFLIQWLAFRVMIGMSKIGVRSSDCWKELTCTTTHYETQPMPNPAAFFFHHLPLNFHRFEVALTFFEQLVLPFFILFPFRLTQIAACLLECIFQLGIVGTGNYAWINFIGALPCLVLLDDDFLSPFFTKPTDKSADSSIISCLSFIYKRIRNIMHAIVFVVIMSKSVHPVKELFSNAPWLHFYDPYFLVNAQGVFGFINKKRVNLVLDYTFDEIDSGKIQSCADDGETGLQGNNGQMLSCKDLTRMCDHREYGKHIRQRCRRSCGVCKLKLPSSVTWKSLEFMNLPGDVETRPGFNSPYHYRLDWQVWIETTASMEHATKNSQLSPPGIVNSLIAKILAGDSDAMELISTDRMDLIDPKTGEGPTAIRARFFRYRFASYEDWKTKGKWWKRSKIGKPSYYVRDLDKSTTPIRQSPPNRSWSLFTSTIGAVLATVGFMQADTSKLLQFVFLCTFILVFAASLFQDYFKPEDIGLPKDEDFLSINLKICATVGFLTNTGFILSWTRSGGTKFRLSRAVEWSETFIIGTLAYLQQQDIHIAAFLSEMPKYNTES